MRIQVTVTSKLKEVRQEKGISVRKLAELTGSSRGYISDVENNHKVPTIYILCLFAAALEVKPEVLYEYSIYYSDEQSVTS